MVFAQRFQALKLQSLGTDSVACETLREISAGRGVVEMDRTSQQQTGAGNPLEDLRPGGDDIVADLGEIVETAEGDIPVFQTGWRRR